MTRALIVHACGPGVTVQDAGRPGYLGYGVSRGGAADRLALAEGAALLAQSGALAALELAGMGGEFEAGEDLRIALTGAPMRASLDGRRLAWHASHGHCAKCGAASEMAMSGWQRDCPACGAHHFPRTDPVVIAVVHRGERCLLGRGHGWPETMYSALAGEASRELVVPPPFAVAHHLIRAWVEGAPG